jgi:UDP-glucose 4-epimerase
MRVLVTGGAGFIGSWVAEVYRDAGHSVLVVDDLSTGSLHNVPQNVEFVRASLLEQTALARIFDEFRPEVVNHHAAQVSVTASVSDPRHDANVNILGTLALLDLCVAHHVRKLIFASTGGAIYGDATEIPTAETYRPAPFSPYGVAKFAVEHYVRVYHRNHGLDAVILRYGNVYGPRQAPHTEAGVVAIFCTRMLGNQPCVVFGDGKQTRDYVYVSDIARANLLAVDAPFDVYNLGTGEETTVLRLVELLEQSSDRAIPLEFHPERSGEVRRSCLDASLAHRRLNWYPEVAVPTGLQHTWNWYRHRADH